jgi:hypothetical protein
MMENELAISEKRFNKIITRAGDPYALTFKTIDSKALTEINEWMPEVNRASNAFNKQNSQTTMSLMTMNMIDAGPYRVLRQILAQVQKKRSALKENLYNLEKKKIEYKELQAKETLTELEELEMNKIACDIIDAQGPIEGALKELYALKQRYQEICKNKNIDPNWDERDFEENEDGEIKHHITSIFRNMIRDKMCGTANHGSAEYAEQFGVNPITAYMLVDNYLNQVKQAVSDGKLVGIESHYEFYDKMYAIFKDSYKKAAARIGLDHITHAESLFKNHD